MKIDEMLVKALVAYDATRERSLQKEIGVSQIGGCRRSVYFYLNGEPKVNNTLRLPALMGTAIHKMIEEAIINEAKETWADYETEKEVTYDGLKGHIDLFIPSAGAVIDWKTTKLKNLDYFPSKQQRWQVQLYAYLLENNGYEVKTVTLVGIPRDGDERNIKTHTEEYNREIALDGMTWLREVQAMTMPPAPERYAAQFCQHYCSYFGDSCGGKGKEVTAEVIEDIEIISAVEKFIEVDSKIKELDKVKDGIKAALENVNGTTPNGVKVSWSQIAGRSSIDEAEVLEKLGYVPKTQGEPSMRLSVK
jgi:CRISPR/Cas system-associated exonuclease Cas4 (RecB family)